MTRNMRELLMRLAEAEERARAALEARDPDRAEAAVAEVKALRQQVADLRAEEDRERQAPLTGRAFGGHYSDIGFAAPERRAALARVREDDYAAAFWRVVRNWRYPDPEDVRVLMAPEVRAMALGVDSAGGFLVPESFERQIVKKLEARGVMRRLARVLTLVTDHRIPVEADTGQASWIPEGGAFPESEPSFTGKTLGAYKVGRIVKVTEELLNDSGIDLEDYLADAFGRSIGRAEEQAFIAGDGNGKPRGVALDATLGVTAASANAITADEVIELYHALPKPYRETATWVMSDGAALQLRKAKDTTGQYIWQPGLQDGQPDRLLGRPVEISPAMPAPAAGARSVLFGDFSYYWIADRVGRVLQVLKERYADTGHVGFRMYERVDGVLTLAEAVVALEHPAA